MWGPLLTLVGAGILAAAALAFWAELQNWIAGVIERARSVFGPFTHTLQSALVILDRIMVNGQRMIAMTGRVLFRENESQEVVSKEEVRHIDVRALPADVLNKLESGQSASYDLSNGVS